MPDDEVLFKSPTTGKVQAIDPENWDEALSKGYKPTTHTVLYSPEGKRGMVVNSDLNSYVKQGYQTSQPTRFEKERKGAGGIGTALKQFLPQDPTEGRSPLDRKFWFRVNVNPTGPGTLYNELTRPLPTAQGQEGTNLPTGSNAVYRAASVFGPLAGVNAESMEEASGKGDVINVATQAGVPVAMLAGGTLLKPAISAARTGIGRAIHTPEGTLKPGAKLGAQVTGGLAGTAAGSTFGHPYVGAAAGYKAGPTVLSTLFPPEVSAAELAAKEEIAKGLQEKRAAYAEMNEDFAKRTAKQEAKATREQAKADKAQAKADKEAAKAQAKADKEAAKAQATSLSGQFPQATSSATPIGNQPLPAVPQGTPTQFPPVEGVTSTAPTRRAAMPPPPEVTPAAQDLISRNKRLVKPGEAPTAEDLKRAGDYTQIDTQQLVRLARFGDEIAKNELVRRQRLGLVR